MDRKEFLSAVGISGAAFAVLNCLGCSKSSDTNPQQVAGPSGIDFTLDLSATANAALLTNGGSLAVNGVIVARTNAGKYIAVQQSCTHQRYMLVYNAANNTFFCNNHGSAFNSTGGVINSPANVPLTVYNTQATGTSLRIFS
jgi:cytochrome b6-f complex iron-sulfur subunit